MRRLLFLVVVLNVALVALVVPGAASVPWVAAEGLALVALFLCLPAQNLRRGVAWTVGTIYGVSALFVMLDSAIRASLGRSLNLYLDVTIARASLELLVSNLGLPLTLLVFVVVLGLCGLLAVLMAWLLLRIGELGHRLAGHALAVTLAALTAVGLSLPAQLVGATAVRIGANHAGQAWEARHATERFRARIESPGQGGEPSALPGLTDTTVVLAFVESYGVSALFDERYRPHVQPALNRIGEVVDQRGLQVVSGRLRSPVQGGQSWLAHATLLSGLWTDSQQDYDALLASGWPTLIDDFQRTGHEALTMVPAVTRPWPEGRAWGYDRILDAHSLGYRGPALNWVTMPDQYVWSHLYDGILQQATRPVFAELALISSHAPWVPVLPVLDDWQAIGDGQVFEPWRDAGEAPVSLWRDPDRVRDHYARAVAYSLEVIAGYIEHRMDPDTLLVVIGDHQPAPLVTGDGASRDVPVHIISARPRLVEPFSGAGGDGRDGLRGFRSGIQPGHAPGPDMSRFRPFLHFAFGTRGNLSHP